MSYDSCFVSLAPTSVTVMNLMQISAYQGGRFSDLLTEKQSAFTQKITACIDHTLHVNSGEHILRQGEKVDHIYIANAGSVSMHVIATNGRRFQLGTVNCHQQLFGEMEFFTDSACQWNIVAESDVVVSVIPAKVLETVIRENPDMMIFFCHGLARDYEESLDVSTQRLLHPITYNIAYDLWQRSQQTVTLGSSEKMAREAERFGTSSRVYRRAVSELIKLGLVEKQGNELIVCNMNNLKAFLNAEA